MRTSRRPGLILFTFVALTGAACAPARVSESAAGPLHGGSDVITEKDLAEPTLGGATVIDAIRRLRPRFLSDRSGGYAGLEGGPRVSLNGSAGLVALSELSRFGIAEISEIRYLSAADASQRFGLHGTLSPVLIVTLRRP